MEAITPVPSQRMTMVSQSQRRPAIKPLLIVYLVFLSDTMHRVIPVSQSASPGCEFVLEHWNILRPLPS